MNSFWKFLTLIIFLLIAWWAYLYNSYNSLLENKISLEHFEVKKWDNTYKIKEKLCKENIIENCLAFDIYLYKNKFNNIKKWVYSFSGVNLEWFFKQLEKGPKQEYVKFTILPWWTSFDIKKQLSENNQTIFLNLVKDKEFIKQLKENYPILNKFWDFDSLEWFLYPDTYFFKKSDLSSSLFPQLLIKTAIKNFQKKWKSINCDKNCNPYKLSNYEILILASIVEKEEKNSKNKPLVADILIRRYKNNWKIGADWTLCYNFQVESKECKNYLYNKYLKDKTNLYNTRARLWLPPTPVGNPTINTIKAVLYPQKNNYWYYLHDKNWQIHYWKNWAEHESNKYKYLK